MSGHFGTSAKVSLGHFGTGAKVSWVRSVLGPKCPGSEVSVLRIKDFQDFAVRGIISNSQFLAWRNLLVTAMSRFAGKK